jgi:hypothetical protein
MTTRLLGFSNFKALMGQGNAAHIKSNSVEVDSDRLSTSFDYKYPVAFQEIKSKFGRQYNKYDNLKRGVAILADEEELAQYLFSFGNMHEAKLKKAYSELFESLSIADNQKVEIIDYACGQGLATIVLLNYLEANFDYCISNILKIILVEPSQVALKRAGELLGNTSKLQHINKEFDCVAEHDLKTDSKPIKIHLFSNILDMGDNHFDIDNIANTVLNSQSGINYFVCVSALNKNKLDYFMSLFEGCEGFEELSSCSGQFKKQNWQIQYNIFKVGV